MKKQTVRFYLVQYTVLFNPHAYTEIIVTNNFEKWKKLYQNHLFSYEEEITMEKAHDLQNKVGMVQISYMREDTDWR